MAPNKRIMATKKSVKAKIKNHKSAKSGAVRAVPVKAVSPKAVKSGKTVATPPPAKAVQGKPASRIPAKIQATAKLAHSKKDAASLEAVCREVACENLATTAGYCRLHYIKNWKKIKRKELILKERKLNQYIEELVVKYPDKYIEAIRQDLANDKEFSKVIHDLDLDEGIDEFDSDGENVDVIIDNIKRDFDDDNEF